ncbi:MAG TPA: phosphatase PAP2 family protein [Flavisolibacter sp.]|nr:phosphatase PAP2 family protein [Flavisolibacter sp.]
MLQSTEYRHFRNATLFSLIMALIVALFILTYGKVNSFLVINKYNSPQFDYVFKSWTYLGDGIIWVPLFLYVLFFKRDYFVAVLAALMICTVLTHLLKRVIYPEEFRPIVVLGEKVRVIQGYYMNRQHSFPSGHTSTAFTLALLLVTIVKKNFWVYFFPVIAFFVGYSRVYLAQHFVTDVFAGMLVGIVSSYLSLLIYEWFRKRKQKLELEDDAIKKEPY